MRPRKNNVIKGPVFPSFLNQRTGPHEVMVWKPGIQSLKQRTKNLQRACRSILESRDPETMRVGALVVQACERELHPKLASLILINAAMEAANSTGEPWHVCASVLTNQFIETRVARLKSFADQPIATASTEVSPPAERI